MDKDQLDGLLALKLVAEKRNFTAAAEELGVSPPAISKMVKHLEQRLGVALLSRTTRSTSLTEAGERFLSQTGPALEQILGAIKGVGSYAVKPSGTLRINLPRAAFHPYVEPLLQSFAKKNPDVTVDLYFEDETSDIIEGGFDAGIRHSDILAKDMIGIRLSGPIRFVIAGSKKYLDKAGRPKQPKDLLTHNCIRFRFGHTSIYDRWEFEHKGRDLQVHVKGSLIMNDPLLLIDAAVDGWGLIYTVDDSIRDHLKSGKLETVLDQYAPSSTGYYLYYPQRSNSQPKLRAFVEHIQDYGKTN
jgi:DNA-binding transcriptional LysR family regulator